MLHFVYNRSVISVFLYQSNVPFSFDECCIHSSIGKEGEEATKRLENNCSDFQFVC